MWAVPARPVSLAAAASPLGRGASRTRDAPLRLSRRFADALAVKPASVPLVRTTPPDGRTRARIVIVDDHPVIRDAVRMALEGSDGFHIVGEAADATRALDLCRTMGPDLVLLDLSLPDADGVAVAERLLRECPGLRVLALAALEDELTLFRCLRSGVHGYLQKTASTDDVRAAVQAVLRGERTLGPDAGGATPSVLRELARRARRAAAMAGALTGREQQVLALLPDGLTMRAMAERLRVSDRTVETHMAHLYRKLGVRNRAEALHRAVALGLVDLGPERP